MPRVMVVVLGVGVLVWALAFFDFGGRPRARGGAAAAVEPSAVATRTEVAARTPAGQPKPKADRPGPTVARAPVALAAPRSAVRAEPNVIALRPSKSEAPMAQPEVRSHDQGALSTVTGELGEGSLSPEYAEMERTYAHEPRDGLWAEGEERHLRDLLARSGLASEVGLVNCQETLCRVLLESDDHDLYARLLAVPGWTELTGLGPGSTYSHRSGQLSVYFSRRGSGQAAR